MRVVDRLLSVVLALALLLLGLAVAAEVVHNWVGQAGHLLVPWEDAAAWGRAHAFRDPVVLAIGAGLGVIGLALLVTGVRRHRAALLVLQPHSDTVTFAVSRSSMRRALAAQAEDVDGVRRASVRLRRRRADVTAVTALRDPGDLREQVEAAVSGWLAGLGLVRPQAVRARLTRKAS